MNTSSAQSGHWTDEDLLAYLYGIGPTGNHLVGCSECQSRLSTMQSNRETIERSARADDSVSVSFLAAQRRTIYQRMDRNVPWWSAARVRRWAAGLTTACVLSGSIVMYQHNRDTQLAQERINDAKLAQEVAAMAQDTDVSAMAPLEGLFE